MVNFDAPAILERLKIGKVGPVSEAAKHGDQIFSGTLAECLTDFSGCPIKSSIAFLRTTLPALASVTWTTKRLNFWPRGQIIRCAAISRTRACTTQEF